MMDYRAAQRYSRALFGLAKKQDGLDDVAADFLAVRRMVESHSEITNLVSNSTISLAEKEDFLDKILPSDIAKLLVNFLKVLVRKRRFREVNFIQERFHALYEKHKGIRKVNVISAAELSQSLLEKLRGMLERKMNAYIELVPEIDPSMIGGLILRYEDKEINASFRDRLRDLKQKITQA